mmetsp:Transcript_5032/g.14582  ORF Transcript_5032/g.14582 Transcript_5032/m.14582 type:complete len:272 (-) Transcript_5032:87-902(-)
MDSLAAAVREPEVANLLWISLAVLATLNAVLVGCVIVKEREVQAPPSQKEELSVGGTPSTPDAAVGLMGAWGHGGRRSRIAARVHVMLSAAVHSRALLHAFVAVFAVAALPLIWLIAVSSHGASSPSLSWHEIIHFGVHLTNLTGALVLITSAFLAVTNTVLLVISNMLGRKWRLLFPCDHSFLSQPLTLNAVRIAFGTTVGYALQLLVVADVLDTLLHPVEGFEMQTLFKLGLVVAVREVLAFMTNLEVKHLQHGGKHHDGHGLAAPVSH